MAGRPTRNAPAMALVKAKHEALRRPAADVVLDDVTEHLARRMEATMRARTGRALGLAAPQVGASLRLITVVGTYAATSGRELVTLANPVLIEATGKVEADLEGCLTFPGQFWIVPRHPRVVIGGVDVRDGAGRRLVITDPLGSRLWQHELDHLAGQLIADGGFPRRGDH